MKWVSVPLWAVAPERRDTVEPASLGDEVLHYSIPALEETGKPVLEASPEIRSQKLLVQEGDLLVGRLNPRKGRVVLVTQSLQGRTIASTEFVSVVPTHVSPRFLAYAVSSELVRQALDSQVRSVTRSHQRVDPEFITHLKLDMPPMEDQQRIADFLDDQVTRIDQETTELRRLLGLGRERHDAFKSLLLFGRDRPGVTKDSGVPSIGLIPAHWEVVRNKAFWRESTQLSATGQEELLSVSHLTGVTPRSEKTVYMFMAESMMGYKTVRPGDLVINTMWAWMGALGVSQGNGIVSPAYGVYRRWRGLGADEFYLDSVLRSQEYVDEMARFSTGVWSSRLRLYPEAFLGLRFPLPPPEEQVGIADRVRESQRGVASLGSDIDRAVELLEERKRSLITAAVTGELDVSSASSRAADAVVRG